MEGEATADELLLVGRVIRAHGVKGELKVVAETDDPHRFKALEVVYLGARPEDAEPQPVESVRFHTTKRGPLVLLKLDGVDGRDEAELLRQRLVFAREGDLPPLEDGELFVHDLVGLDVITESGEAIGSVREVMEGPAHAVYVVARPGRSDALVPAVEAFVADVDLDAGRLVIRPIDGLLD